jgi:hypothetical protein
MSCSRSLFFPVGKLMLAALLLCLVQAVNAQAPEKPRIAVMEPMIGEGVSEWSRKYLKTQTLWDEMEASIQKSRKFEVLSRKQEVLESIMREQDSAKSKAFAGDAAAQGQLKNANFQVIPVVQDFKFYRSSTPIPNLESKYWRQDSGMLEMQAQIVDVATGAIKSTFYMKSSFGTGRSVVNSKSGAPSSVHFTNMAKEVSGQMSDQLIDFVFPMIVLNAQGTQLFINRGQDGGLKEGDKVKVFRPGVALIDPYTGEKIGDAESEIGEAVVTRVNPKFSILEGSALAEPAQQGDIVRKP